MAYAGTRSAKNGGPIIIAMENRPTLAYLIKKRMLQGLQKNTGILKGLQKATGKKGMKLDKWDGRFLALCRHVSTWSKDPSTKVGSAVVRQDNTLASIGYNGLPRGVIDSHERLHNRDLKISMVQHAESNAILSSHERLDGCTLYVWPMPPCSHCAAVVIQAGIIRVVAPKPGERWRESCELGRTMMLEAGVDVEWV